MPKTLEIRQLLDCTEETFWERIFHNEDFNHYLYDGLGFKYELQEWNPETGYRRAKLWPMQQMPRAVASVLGERFSYIEEGTFDAEAERYDFRVITSAVADRIRVRGTVTVEAVPPNQCERRVALEIGADVLGLGRLIEAYFVAMTREEYAKNAALVNEYLASAS
ncbi:MAG: hypothetical protein DRH23_02485 [Deltaproteobacteria bacterium]|nr:DUF2505 family protein [Deltaproteobacteria bacterium]MBW2190137.1 DUF2505 family protein [Deltaproteobacteria bacterium]MBW2405247.1 DUF2505 family protein [Deltaproteobacteria bacterium]MBW2547812.1 DUF2505 family protein [Deltaproteobacteria bacterium]MBW2716986.1 DUF2505 family protein [Deltaproteobacteria bacterium]